MGRYKDIIVFVEDTKIPLRIHREDRKNIRISVGKKQIHLRIPLFLRGHSYDEQLRWAKKWIKEQYYTDPMIKDRFSKRVYETGTIIKVQNEEFVLDVDIDDRKTHGGKKEGNKLVLRLSIHDTELNRDQAIKTLISRLVSYHFKPWIEAKVNYFNDRYIGQQINSINLKYLSSKWGSCSNRNNINLSTRLLLAPEDVIDYIILHELAHLIELNHSHRFWKIVRNAMPNFQEKEQWLKEYGSKCDF